jgi:urease accessory protein
MYLSDFVGGLAHPISGADHILAMVAIGLWGVVAGGRAVWAWRVAFATMVLAGFVAATFGLYVPLVQPAMASSILIALSGVALIAMPVADENAHLSRARIQSRTQEMPSLAV